MSGFEGADRGVDLEKKTLKFVKKDYQSRHWAEEKSIDNQKEDERDRPKQVMGEIRTITGGPIVGGHTGLWERQVKHKSTVHLKLPIAKHHRLGDEGIVFSERDARGVKQQHDDPLVIMLIIERYNTRRVLVDNGS